MTANQLIANKAQEVAQNLTAGQPAVLHVAFAEAIQKGFDEILALAKAGEIPGFEAMKDEQIDPKELEHKGLHYRRTQVTGRDVSKSSVREKSFADTWAQVNSGEVSEPVLASLLRKNNDSNIYGMDFAVPYNKASVVAAATAVQWLGSPVGFPFLVEALKGAGYEVKENAVSVTNPNA